MSGATDYFRHEPVHISQGGRAEARA